MIHEPPLHSCLLHSILFFFACSKHCDYLYLLGKKTTSMTETGGAFLFTKMGCIQIIGRGPWRAATVTKGVCVRIITNARRSRHTVTGTWRIWIVPPSSNNRLANTGTSVLLLREALCVRNVYESGFGLPDSISIWAGTSGWSLDWRNVTQLRSNLI